MNKTFTAVLAAGCVVLGAAPASARKPKYRVDLDCRALNDFGYVASAHGRLTISGRGEPSGLAVRGQLELDTRLFGDPAEPREVTVEGTLDVFGQYLSLGVTSEGDSVESLFLALLTGSSSLQGSDGVEYQTECTYTRVWLPTLADIVPEGKLRFALLPDGQLRAQLDVFNLGNTPVVAPQIALRIAGQEVVGALHDALLLGDALGAGESGFVEAELPAGTLERCGEYDVAIDIDGSVQAGAFDPFDNDSGRASTPCLRWNTPIDDDALGVSADPLLRGKTLEAIVSSQSVARADGQLCSSCHFVGSGKPYSPPAGTISPALEVGGRSWSGSPGWIDVFDSQTIKPAYLKQAFLRWRQDGAQ